MGINDYRGYVSTREIVTLILSFVILSSDFRKNSRLRWTIQDHVVPFLFYNITNKNITCYIIQLLCEGNMTICSPEAVNIARGRSPRAILPVEGEQIVVLSSHNSPLGNINCLGWTNRHVTLTQGQILFYYADSYVYFAVWKKKEYWSTLYLFHL